MNVEKLMSDKGQIKFWLLGVCSSGELCTSKQDR